MFIHMFIQLYVVVILNPQSFLFIILCADYSLQCQCHVPNRMSRQLPCLQWYTRIQCKGLVCLVVWMKFSGPIRVRMTGLWSWRGNRQLFTPTKLNRSTSQGVRGFIRPTLFWRRPGVTTCTQSHSPNQDAGQRRRTDELTLTLGSSMVTWVSNQQHHGAYGRWKWNLHFYFAAFETGAKWYWSRPSFRLDETFGLPSPIDATPRLRSHQPSQDQSATPPPLTWQPPRGSAWWWYLGLNLWLFLLSFTDRIKFPWPRLKITCWQEHLCSILDRYGVRTARIKA